MLYGTRNAFKFEAEEVYRGSLMSKISVIGLGAMGTALAQAQLRAVHDVTVWNRTPQKMESLAALGAKAP